MKMRSFLLATFLFVVLPLGSSFAQVGISINIAPPLLPVVAQPPAPVEGYIWTPGYWAWGDVGYYWVPGVWVAPPAVGLLWTPPWWGWNNGSYVFNEGYWGPTVGFYGGIDYGYGYWGDGYWGGHWEGNAFRYNTAVTRVNPAAVHNTFVDRSVLSKEIKGNRASFNGPNGVKAEPTAAEKAAADNAQKMPPTSQQLARREAASKDRNLQASVNHGQPKPNAIQSFNKSVEHGTGAQGRGAAAAAAKAGNNPANVSGRKSAGIVQGNANRNGAKNYAKSRNVRASEARGHFGKAAGHQRLSLGRHEMAPRSAHPGMGMARPHAHAGMGMARPQAAGNRGGHAPAHQQGRPKH